jgi:anti-sigma factor RsiW
MEEERVTSEPPKVLSAVPTKDPRKVAAGKAGAAARKAKQEKLKDELRKAKAALIAEPPASQGVILSQDIDQVRQSDEPQTVSRYSLGPWLIGCVVIGGLGLAWLATRAHNRFVQSNMHQSAPVANASKPPVIPHKLNKSANPFYME